MGNTSILKGYDLFKAQIPEVLSLYPEFQECQFDGKSIITGNIDIVDINSKYWTSYAIEIHPTNDFPYRFPLLFEVGGKIPRIADWHVYEDNNNCCVKILPAEIIRCKSGITITEYIKEEVVPYLFNQTHRIIEGYYVNGEFSHGAIGFYEYYSKVLGTQGNIFDTCKLLHAISITPKPPRTSVCFCGSGIKYRKCHKLAYDTLREVGVDNLKAHAYSIFNLIAKK